MRLDFILIPLTSALLLSACIAKDSDSLGELETGDDPTAGTGSSSAEGGTETDAETDDDDESDDDPTATGETSETGEPACPDPDLDLYYPAACPDAGPTIILPEIGCYQGCDAPDFPCAVGSCVEVQVNPCVCDEGEDCCGACMGTTLLCIEGATDAVCEQIIGTTFESVDEMECGISKEGPVLCNWSVEFTAEGDYLWQYSDVGQGGGYSCVGGAITVDNDPALEISYDPESGVLTWDGIDYVAAPA